MNIREHAIAAALFAVMPPHEQSAVLTVFDGIKSAFPDVRDAFVVAVADEALAIETERILTSRENQAAAICGHRTLHC